MTFRWAENADRRYARPIAKPLRPRSVLLALAPLIGVLSVALASASPAAAQAPGAPPSCGSRPATLGWEVIQNGRRRAVDLAFMKGYEGAPVKPVRVTVQRGGIQQLQWTKLNQEQFVYRRRGRETVRLTAIYVENRSRYEVSPPITPGLPGLPSLPLPELPGLPALPGVPDLPALPLLPDLLDEGTPGSTRFHPDFCTRVLTVSVR